MDAWIDAWIDAWMHGYMNARMNEYGTIHSVPKQYNFQTHMNPITFPKSLAIDVIFGFGFVFCFFGHTAKISSRMARRLEKLNQLADFSPSEGEESRPCSFLKV